MYDDKDEKEIASTRTPQPPSDPCILTDANLRTLQHNRQTLLGPQKQL